MMTEIESTQGDYPLPFKIGVVGQVENGERTYEQAQRRNDIYGRPTVLLALRKTGRVD